MHECDRRRVRINAGRDHSVDTQGPGAEYTALVRTYCVGCHNDQLKTGGLSLQNLDVTNVPAHAPIWEKVARKLRSGEMPPSTVRSGRMPSWPERSRPIFRPHLTARRWRGRIPAARPCTD